MPDRTPDDGTRTYVFPDEDLPGYREPFTGPIGAKDDPSVAIPVRPTQSRPESVGPELAALRRLQTILNDELVTFEDPSDGSRSILTAENYRLLEEAQDIVVALRATNHQPVALDVERLARALFEEERRFLFSEATTDERERAIRLANRVLDRYAALAKGSRDPEIEHAWDNSRFRTDQP